MPFGVVGQTGPGMRQVVGFGDPSTGRGNFGGKDVVPHSNQWGLCGVRARNCVHRLSSGLGWCVGWAEAMLY